MKVILFIIFSIILLPQAFCQDTTFFNSQNEKVSNSGDIASFEVTTQNPSDSNQHTVKKYTANGTLIHKKIYTYIEGVGLVGVVKEWYGNGQLKSIIPHNSHGDKDGTLATYWPSGVLKRKDSFRKGRFIRGTCYDSSGKKIKHFDYFVPAQYPGGMKALMKFFKKQLYYPSFMRKSGIEGRVEIRFSIDKNGVVGDIQLYKGGIKIFNKEVERVIKKMPTWEPEKLDGEPIKSWYVIPVTFSLE